eukprot:COSAG01_NODE_4934_length_4611_cov_2.711658_1_plen_1478_part_00
MHLQAVWDGKETRENIFAHDELLLREIRLAKFALFVDVLSGAVTRFVFPVSADGACYRVMKGTRQPNSHDGPAGEDKSRLAQTCIVFSIAQPRVRWSTVDSEGHFTELSDAVGTAVYELVECCDVILSTVTMMKEMHVLLAVASAIKRQKAPSAKASFALFKKLKAHLKNDAAQSAIGRGSEYLAKVRGYVDTTIDTVKQRNCGDWLQGLATTIDALERYEVTAYRGPLTADRCCKRLVVRILDVVWGGCRGNCAKLPKGHPQRCVGECRLAAAFDSDDWFRSESGVWLRAVMDDTAPVRKAVRDATTSGSMPIRWRDEFLKSYLETDPVSLDASLRRIMRHLAAQDQSLDKLDAFETVSALAVQIDQDLRPQLNGLIAHGCKTSEKGKGSLCRLVYGHLSEAMTTTGSAPDGLHMGINATKTTSRSSCQLAIAATGSVDYIRGAIGHIVDVDCVDDTFDAIGGGSGPKAKRIRQEAMKIGDGARKVGLDVIGELEESKYIWLDLLVALTSIPADIKRQYYDETQDWPDTRPSPDHLHVAIHKSLMEKSPDDGDGESQWVSEFFTSGDCHERIERWRWLLRLAMNATSSSDLMLISTWQLTTTLPAIMKTYGSSGVDVNAGDCNKMEAMVKKSKPHYRSLENSKLQSKDRCQQLLESEASAFVDAARESDPSCPVLASKIKQLRNGHIAKVRELERKEDDWREGGLIQQADEKAALGVLGFRFAWALGVKQRCEHLRALRRQHSAQLGENPPAFDDHEHTIEDIKAFLNAPAPWLTKADTARDGTELDIGAPTTLTRLLTVADEEIDAVRNADGFTPLVERLYTSTTVEVFAYNDFTDNTNKLSKQQVESHGKLCQVLRNTLKRNRLSSRIDHPFAPWLMALGDDWTRLQPVEQMYRRERLLKVAEATEFNVRLVQQVPGEDDDAVEVQPCFCPLTLPAKLTSSYAGQHYTFVYYSTTDSPEDKYDYSCAVLVADVTGSKDTSRSYTVWPLSIAEPKLQRTRKSWSRVNDSSADNRTGAPIVQDQSVVPSAFDEKAVFILSENKTRRVLTIDQNCILYGPQQFDNANGRPKIIKTDCFEPDSQTVTGLRPTSGTYIRITSFDKGQALLDVEDHVKYIAAAAAAAAAQAQQQEQLHGTSSTAIAASTVSPSTKPGSIAHHLVPRDLGGDTAAGNATSNAGIESGDTNARGESADVDGETNAGAYQPAGLVNNDTACWVNAAFQAVSACVVEQGIQCHVQLNWANDTQRLAFEVNNNFAVLMRQVELPERNAETLRIALYRAGLQHDAGSQHEDVAAGVIKLVDCLTIASQNLRATFNGMVRTEVACKYHGCGYVSDKADKTAVFSIPTSKNQALQACIDVAFGGVNTVTAYDCPCHRPRGPATITYSVAQAPEILILDLTNPVVSRQGVQFGHSISFGTDGQKFDLVAAIWRTGVSRHRGHFVAVCRYDSMWFSINDGHLMPVHDGTSPPLPRAAKRR